jgi:hypothetical protein
MESNNHKNLIVVILALFIFLIGIYLTKTLPKDQPQEPQKESAYDAETQKALNALETYYSLLANQDYEKANYYHGSGYEYILNLDPSADEENHVLLLEVACETNGFICMEIYEVVSSTKIKEGEYSFIVQFKNNDGELHALPAMGEGGLEEDITDHTIIVIGSGDSYKVTTPLIFYP